VVTIDQLTARAITVFLILTGSFIFYTMVSEALIKIEKGTQLIKDTQKTIQITVTTGAK
jgi:hypothetical protein